MVYREANTSIVQGDAEVMVIPIEDDDDPNNDFRDPPVDLDDIQYVVADSFTPSGVLVDVPNSQIRVNNYGDAKPDDVLLPEDYPTPADSQDVIEVLLKESDTRQFSVTEGSGIDNLVHECEIDSNQPFGGEVTVMQGEVEVLPSATSDPQ